MKRFALFGGDHYYPEGGWDDFIWTFATLEEARAAGKRLSSKAEYYQIDWYQVVDLQSGVLL